MMGTVTLWHKYKRNIVPIFISCLCHWVLKQKWCLKVISMMILINDSNYVRKHQWYLLRLRSHRTAIHCHVHVLFQNSIGFLSYWNLAKSLDFLLPQLCSDWCNNWTRKPRKGAAVIAASMHSFTSCWKFKSPVTLTLTFDRVKVISTYAVYVGLPVYPTMWL